MKRFLACLLLSSPAVTLAEGEISNFIFPPFAKEDIEIPTHTLSDHPDYEEKRSISVEEWRGIMTAGNLSLQDMAGKELVERGDQKTILRLVYSMKQGNGVAISILGSSNSLAVVPYLMEDVAHGSLEYYGSYSFGDVGFGGGWLREEAVKQVASILFSAPEFTTPKFTQETEECLKAIGRGNPEWIQGLSEESRYLVQWWLLNKDAFEAGKWGDTQPLPQEIKYTDLGKDTRIPSSGRWDPERQPPFGCPLWELAESFETWAERIVDPKRRNFDFVALSWDGKKMIEHPAKSLDLKAKPEDRESRKTPAPRNPPEPEPGDGVPGMRGTLWITVIAVLMVVLSIIRWLRRSSTEKI